MRTKEGLGIMEGKLAVVAAFVGVAGFLAAAIPDLRTVFRAVFRRPATEVSVIVKRYSEEGVKTFEIIDEDALIAVIEECDKDAQPKRHNDERPEEA
jgi:hypothetical protein